jgi:hypothetical protein
MSSATRPSFWRDDVIAHMFRTSRRLGRLMLACAAVLTVTLVPTMGSATPSTTYWAPTLATCQAKGVPHITHDTYYGRGTPPPGGRGARVPDRYRLDHGDTAVGQDSIRDPLRCAPAERQSDLFLPERETLQA